MTSSGAGQAPFVTICDGPLKFIRRRDNTKRIILVNPSTRPVVADEDAAQNPRHLEEVHLYARHISKNHSSAPDLGIEVRLRKSY